MLRRPMTVENGERIQAVGIDQPARAACGDSGEAPAHVVAAAKLRLFGDEQPQEGASYVSETDDGQVVGWNGSASEEEFLCPSPGSVLTIQRLLCGKLWMPQTR